MKQKIILLYANPYSITDEKTGEIKKGITCNYYFNTSLSSMRNEDGSVGQRPAKCSVPYTCQPKMSFAPAIYDAEFDMKIGSDGKPVLTIIDLDFVEKLQLVSESNVKDPANKAG